MARGGHGGLWRTRLCGARSCPAPRREGVSGCPRALGSCVQVRARARGRRVPSVRERQNGAHRHSASCRVDCCCRRAGRECTRRAGRVPATGDDGPALRLQCSWPRAAWRVCQVHVLSAPSNPNGPHNKRSLRRCEVEGGVPSKRAARGPAGNRDHRLDAGRDLQDGMLAQGTSANPAMPRRSPLSNEWAHPNTRCPAWPSARGTRGKDKLTPPRAQACTRLSPGWTCRRRA